jgi:hypothetical protein
MGRSSAQHTGSTALASTIASSAIKDGGTVRDSLEFEHMIPPKILEMIVTHISKLEKSVFDIVV